MIKLQTPLDQVDAITSPSYTFGTRTITKDGNEYIYLPGTTSVTKYDWVNFQTANATSPGMSYGSITLLATNAVGLVGIAQGAITANKCGWFQVYGIGWGHTTQVVSSGTCMYASGTAGYVSHYCVLGDLIVGAVSLTSTTSDGTVKVSLSYPYVTNTL